jgi:hypothetical protein
VKSETLEAGPRLLVANTEGVCQACGVTMCGPDVLICADCIDESRRLHADDEGEDQVS